MVRSPGRHDIVHGDLEKTFPGGNEPDDPHGLIANLHARSRFHQKASLPWGADVASLAAQLKRLAVRPSTRRCGIEALDEGGVHEQAWDAAWSADPKINLAAGDAGSYKSTGIIITSRLPESV